LETHLSFVEVGEIRAAEASCFELDLNLSTSRRLASTLLLDVDKMEG